MHEDFNYQRCNIAPFEILSSFYSDCWGEQNERNRKAWKETRRCDFLGSFEKMLLSVDFHTPRVFFFGGRAYPCEVHALRTANGCHYVGMALKEKKIELTVVAKLKKCWNLFLKYSERERAATARCAPDLLLSRKQIFYMQLLC